MNSFITGANRGIGLEYVRQLLEREGHVFAASRQLAEATALHTLQQSYPERLSLIKLDVRNADELSAAVDSVAEKVDALDLLINNAGIYPEGERLGQLDSQQMLETLHNNSVAPILVVQAFRELLSKAHGKVVNVSSRMGSLALAGSGGHSYRASKAALNMYSRVLASELRSAGVIVIAMTPGWVKTDMGGLAAQLTVEDSVTGQLKVIEQLRLKDSGLFFGEDGSQVEW